MTPDASADLRKEYGRRIKAARIQAGWTVASAAAKQANMGRTILANLEAGRFAPTMETLDRLITSLNLDPAHLFLGPDHRPSD